MYSIPEASAVAPLVVKQNITLPPLGLEHLRNCKYLVSLNESCILQDVLYIIYREVRQLGRYLSRD